jgi:hypothetical protein
MHLSGILDGSPDRENFDTIPVYSESSNFKLGSVRISPKDGKKQEAPPGT